ncbi:hypothetical protein RHMOL_Rhmol10G0170100 [Rhododendron molle]|uniref:Uncharacterized protein n=1 Tax=Rhododendron molle TaxID=49168 RepID=A0ACC0M3D9_RHOML|nr:hypothetical protein RHMOL_Rhmol10G0170100 [Rhododendron molle]
MISKQKSQLPSDQGIRRLRTAVEALVLFSLPRTKPLRNQFLALGFVHIEETISVVQMPLCSVVGGSRTHCLKFERENVVEGKKVEEEQ